MANNYPFPMPQPTAQIIDPVTGNWTQVGYKWSAAMWGRTGGATGSNSSAVLQSANNLSDVTSVPAARANLGLGTAAVHNVGDFLQPGDNLSDINNAATARGNLGLGDAATHPASDFATAAQGAKADTAVQTGTIHGWSAPTGTLTRGAYAAYAGQTMGAAYSQTAAQTNDDALKTLAQTVAALLTDLRTTGIIGT